MRRSPHISVNGAYLNKDMKGVKDAVTSDYHSGMSCERAKREEPIWRCCRKSDNDTGGKQRRRQWMQNDGTVGSTEGNSGYGIIGGLAATLCMGGGTTSKKAAGGGNA